MRRAERRRSLAVLALAGSLTSPLPCFGSEVTRPFVSDPAGVAQAMALERVAAKIEAYRNAAQPADDLVVELRDSLAADLGFFMASLRARQPALAGRLAASLESFFSGEEAGPGDSVEAAAAEAEAALRGASSEATARKAAVMSLLLVSETSVSEAYEEAGEGSAADYMVGWGMLQRIKARWDEVRPPDGGQSAEGVDEAIAALDELFSTADPPKKFVSDLEEAEAHAQRLVGFLESTMAADLYPGRDLRQAAATVRELAGKGCANFLQGELDTGRESLVIAAFYYDNTLQAPLSVLAPEAQAEVVSTLGRFGSGQEEEDSFGSDERSEHELLEEALEAAPGQIDAAECTLLLSVLESVQAALTPGAAK